jgi:4-diphosphocytidyl-2-C-methyl-D-erythritol kinase
MPAEPEPGQATLCDAKPGRAATPDPAAADPFGRLAPVVRLAPAKVNLTLAVLGVRPDGYHALHSVMVPVALADRLSISVLPPGATDTLHVDGFDPGPAADNLVLRAIAAARRVAATAWGCREPLPPLAARLEKRIPVAAGLAGGSSDAAAAVDAALEAWGVELDVAERHRLAASLGSDVPFFLAGGPALVEGRGEQVTPLGWLRDGDPGDDRPGLLLVTPSLGIATPAAFRAWDAGAKVAGGAARLASAHLADELRTGLRVADLLARASVLAAANDLAPAAWAVEPGLVPFKRALLRLLGRPVGLSGSGPTHWALYPSHAEASAAADRLRTEIAAGNVPSPGTREPFVAATRILARHPETRRDT